MTSILHYSLRLEISITQDKFHRFLITVPETALKLPSRDPHWNNAEVLSLMSVSPLIIKSILKKNMYDSGFPQAPSNRVTSPLIQRVNESFIRTRARFATRFSIALEYDETCARVLEMLAGIPDDGFEKKLTIHAKDPLLSETVTVEQLFHYVKNHFYKFRQEINIGSSAHRRDLS